jgi:WD40 repeat protein
MRYLLFFLALTILSFALIGHPVQGAAPYRVDSITSTPTPSPATPGASTVPLPFRAVARLGTGSINAVQISPDSKLIAVGGSVGVTVYDAATLKAVWSARGDVATMKWSPDSVLLATDMSGVSVWDGATGRLANRLTDYSPTDLEWSPDSRRLVMASWGGLGLIWYLKAGTLPIHLAVRKCDLHRDGWCIREMYAALSPDGRLYATAYAQGTGGDIGDEPLEGVIIWDALTGVQKRVLPTSGDQLKWLHDSTHLLVNGEWDARTGQPVEMTSVTNDAAPTPEGSFPLPSGELVVWEYNCNRGLLPCLVDMNTGEVLCAPDCLVDEYGDELCHSALISPDFKLCANQDTSSVAFSQIPSGTEARRVEDVAKMVALSPDWSFLVGWSASSPDDLNVWKVSDGQMIGRLAHRSNPLNTVAWSPDGRRLAIVDQYSGVQLWDAVTGHLVQGLRNPAAAPNDPMQPIRAAFSPDGSRLAVSGISGTSLIIWDLASGQPLVQTDIDGSTEMVWSPHGTEIALVNTQLQVIVVDAATGNTLRSTPFETNVGIGCIAGLIGYVNGIGWSPDGKQIAVGSCGGQVILYDAATLNKVSTLTYRTGAKLDEVIPYLAYSPDGKSLATVIPLPDWYILAIWDLRSGQVRTNRLVSNSSYLPFSSLAWSPNGKFLAIGRGTMMFGLYGNSLPGGDIAIFNGRTAEQVALLHGHTDDTDGISFSPDSKKLASASLDGTVLIWDLTGL